MPKPNFHCIKFHISSRARKMLCRWTNWIVSALLTLSACLNTFCIFAQQQVIVNGDTVVVLKSSKGDVLLGKGKVKKAISAYRLEYKKNPIGTAYNFACAFARDNQTDSAFKYLEYVVKHDTVFATFCLSDPDFICLRTDSRWISFKDTVVADFIKQRHVKVRNVPLAVKLWDMMAWDQAYYQEIELAEKQFGMSSSIERALWDLKSRINDINQFELDSIIQINGWPKISEVGQRAANSAFLIIQHSTLVKQEQYLPVIKQLCEAGEADWQSYALMYDRVQVGRSKKQLYGTQVYFNDGTHRYELYPIEDETHVDIRRNSMGMGPLKNYVSQWGIKYNPVQ